MSDVACSTLLVDMYLLVGSKNSKIIDAGHDRCSLFNTAGRYGLDRTDTERLFRQLVIHGILDEELQVTAADHTACYIKVGQRANDLLAGRLKVSQMFC